MLEIEFTRKGLKLYNAVRILLRDGNTCISTEDVIWDLIKWEFQVYKESRLIPVGLEYIVTKDSLTVSDSFPTYDYSHLETIILLAKTDKTQPYFGCFTPRELRVLTYGALDRLKVRDEVLRIQRDIVIELGHSDFPIYPWWFIKTPEEEMVARREYYESLHSDMFLNTYKRYIDNVEQNKEI